MGGQCLGAIIRRLRSEPEFAQRVGAAARAAMEKLYSPAERARIIEYYLL
jgi:hypothetical protein